MSLFSLDKLCAKKIRKFANLESSRLSLPHGQDKFLRNIFPLLVFFSFFVYIFVFSPLSNFLRPSLNFLAVCLGKLTMEGKAKEGKGFFALSFFHSSFPLPSPMGAVKNDGPARNKVGGRNGGRKQNWPVLM